MMNMIYKELNDALQEFNRLGIAEQFDFQKLYLYSIITHSTAIEGSTVSEIENTLMSQFLQTVIEFGLAQRLERRTDTVIAISLV